MSVKGSPGSASVLRIGGRRLWRTGRAIAPLSVGLESARRYKVGRVRPKTAQALAQRAWIVLVCTGPAVSIQGSRTTAPRCPSHTGELEDVIRHYLDLNNRHRKPLIWTETADQILESIARFCKRTSDSRTSESGD
jgi:hypothetical protein